MLWPAWEGPDGSEPRGRGRGRGREKIYNSCDICGRNGTTHGSWYAQQRGQREAERLEAHRAAAEREWMRRFGKGKGGGKDQGKTFGHKGKAGKGNFK